MHKRVRRRHAISSRIIAIARGEAGWIQQAGNQDETIYFGVIERQFSPPSPHVNSRRKSW